MTLRGFRTPGIPPARRARRAEPCICGGLAIAAGKTMFPQHRTIARNSTLPSVGLSVFPSVVVRKVARFSRCSTKAVVSTLVDAVMARLTDDYTISQGSIAPKFHMFDVVRLRTLTEFVSRTAGFAQFEDWRPASGA